MTQIVLHGALGKEFGKFHNFNIGRPIDAIRALMANKRGFRHALKAWGRKGRFYEIICDGEAITEENELIHRKKINRIDIVPAILGTSKVVKIIIGVVLIIVGVIFKQPWLIKLGAGLIIGGVMEMLFPPEMPSFHTEAQGRSFIFSTTTNSTSRGTPVQIGYGRLRIGSQVISTTLEPVRLGGGNSAAYDFPQFTKLGFGNDLANYIVRTRFSTQ